MRLSCVLKRHDQPASDVPQKWVPPPGCVTARSTENPLKSATGRKRRNAFPLAPGLGGDSECERSERSYASGTAAGASLQPVVSGPECGCRLGGAVSHSRSTRDKGGPKPFRQTGGSATRPADVLFARKRGVAAGRTGQMERRARNLPLSAPLQKRVPHPDAWRPMAIKNTVGTTTVSPSQPLRHLKNATPESLANFAEISKIPQFFQNWSLPILRNFL